MVQQQRLFVERDFFNPVTPFVLGITLPTWSYSLVAKCVNLMITGSQYYYFFIVVLMAGSSLNPML